MFWERNIQLMRISQVFDGLTFYLPVIALLFHSIIDSYTLVGIIFSIEAISLFLLEVPSGAIADLFGRKRTLLFSAVSFFLALLALTLAQNVVTILLFVIFVSLSRSLKSGTQEAIIYESLEQQNKKDVYEGVIGKFYSLWPLLAAISALFSSLLVSFELMWVIYFTFISPVGMFLAFLFLKEPPHIKSVDDNVFAHMKSTTKYLLRHNTLLLISFITFLVYAFMESTFRLNSLLFDFKGVALEALGIFAAVAFGMSFLGFHFSHRIVRILGQKPALIWSTVFIPVLMIGGALAQGYFSPLLLTLGSFFWGIRRPIMSALSQKFSSPSQRSTTVSLVNFAGQLGVAIVSPLIGVLAGVVNVAWAFGIVGVLTISIPFVTAQLQID